MTAAATIAAIPDPVDAPVRYLADDENLAVYMASVAGGEVAGHKGNFIDQPVTIRNGRGLDLALDREGFVLAPQDSAVSDFYDDGQIAAIYDDEIRALVKHTTGAARVDIFDHTRRAASDDIRKARMIREPAATVHNDYTARSGPNRMREILGAEAEVLLKGRAAIVNVWRSIAGTVRNMPLTLCDASTVAPEDLVSITRQAKDRIGEIQFARRNPDHRWYWFPKMTMDEALIFKTYDSAEDGRARFTIHTAFDDPAAPANAPVRESIETRCFVFYQTQATGPRSVTDPRDNPYG